MNELAILLNESWRLKKIFLIKLQHHQLMSYMNIV